MNETLKIEVDIAKSLEQLKDSPYLAAEMSKLLLGGPMAERLEKSEKIYDIVRKFIDDNQVSCAEASSKDSVYENAPTLVYELAEIVGYYQYE